MIQLPGPPQGIPIDPGAEQAIRQVAERGITDLVYTAEQIAQREGFDRITLRHIYMARDILENKGKPTRVRKIAKTAGDILLGASGTSIAVQLGTMAESGQVDIGDIVQLTVWIVIFCISLVITSLASSD